MKYDFNMSLPATTLFKKKDDQKECDHVGLNFKNRIKNSEDLPFIK